MKALRVGSLIVLAYVAAAAGTLRLTSHRVRPLFEGFLPPAAYQWVHPPAQFRSGNVKPKALDTDIGFEGAATGASGVATADGQVLLNLPSGAIPARAGDTKVTFTITPLDPAPLGSLPNGLDADGNAYRVAMAYRPSGQPVTGLAAPGNLVMETPSPAKTLLFSADGRTWQAIPSEPVGGAGFLGTAFSKAGWYVAGATHVAFAPRGGRGDTGRILAAAGAVAALALLLGFTPALRRRLRRR